MTREHWRTKLQRRPRRGPESLRSSHAVDSVGVERRVSPPPRRWAASLFLESIDLFRYISRKFLGLITQEEKSLLLCALCATDFGRLRPRKRCLQW